VNTNPIAAVIEAVLAVCALLGLPLAWMSASAAHDSAIAAQESAKKASEANAIAGETLRIAQRTERGDVPLLVMDHCHPGQDVLPNGFVLVFTKGGATLYRTGDDVVHYRNEVYDCRVRNVGPRVAADVRIPVEYRYEHYRDDAQPQPRYVGQNQRTAIVVPSLLPNDAEQVHIYLVNADERFPIVATPGTMTTYYDATRRRDVTVPFTINSSYETLLHSGGREIVNP